MVVVWLVGKMVEVSGSYIVIKFNFLFFIIFFIILL